MIYFVLAEISIVASDEARIERLAYSKGGGYRIVRNVRRRPDILFSTVLAGINLTTVLFTILLKREVGFMMGIILSTLFISVVGEIAVKSLGVNNPEAIAKVVAPPLIFFHWLLYPIILMIKLLGDGFLRIFGFKAGEMEKTTKHEMVIAVRESKVSGGIEPEQYTAMDAISKLSQTDVRDIMIPRVDIKAVEAGSSKKELYNILKDSEVSRFPVYRESIDNIIGVLFVEDVIGRVEKWKIEDKLRPIKFLSGDRSLDAVLPELLRDRIGCAIIIDEYGGTEGFVSTDDVLFSIFESQIGAGEGEEGAFIVNGNLRPERIGIETEEDTLAGFIVRELEEIPKEGQKIKTEGMEITVLDADERRVKKVLIKREKND
ncbi:HlyC/CorC family transporter [candidate division WOR-3 bacterium]|nr:HlyC/CorC family transporter [candidate division WOR-3 bacterium]